VVVCLAIWLIMRFTRVLLRTPEEQPILDRCATLTQHGALVVAVLSLFIEYYVSIRLANSVGSVTALILWLVGWNSFRIGNPASPYFLMAWTLLIVGGLTYSLKSWGIIPSTLLTEHGWQIGSAVEAILLSLAIANRINVESKQRIQRQSEAQKAQATALDIQRKANETLEQCVRQRTAELEAANQKLQQLSETDQLTGLHNRRSLDGYMKHSFGKEDSTDYFLKMADEALYSPNNRAVTGSQ